MTEFNLDYVVSEKIIISLVLEIVFVCFLKNLFSLLKTKFCYRFNYSEQKIFLFLGQKYKAEKL